ncbi:MAG: sulfurtransferase TusA family protein [Desulfobacteraceae bacterium]|nr:MAG: sulfurtransferase TusA family protein [Desulfobacteraceae bacterium]
MTAIIKLDLQGVVFPLNLLKCKWALKEMQVGDVLEVKLMDRDVVTDLLTIVGRSADGVVYQEEKQGAVCIGIKKGAALKFNG